VDKADEVVAGVAAQPCRAVFVGVLAALALLSLRHVSEFLYFKY